MVLISSSLPLPLLPVMCLWLQVRKHALPKLQANLQRKASDLRAFYLPQGLSTSTSEVILIAHFIQ